MVKNVECLCWHKVEAVTYFELLGMRYGDVNAVTHRVFKGPATLLNLSTCTIFRTQADLGLLQLLR